MAPPALSFPVYPKTACALPSKKILELHLKAVNCKIFLLSCKFRIRISQLDQIKTGFEYYKKQTVQKSR